MFSPWVADFDKGNYIKLKISGVSPPLQKFQMKTSHEENMLLCSNYLALHFWICAIPQMVLITYWNNSISGLDAKCHMFIFSYCSTILDVIKSTHTVPWILYYRINWGHCEVGSEHAQVQIRLLIDPKHKYIILYYKLENAQIQLQSVPNYDSMALCPEY